MSRPCFRLAVPVALAAVVLTGCADDGSPESAASPSGTEASSPSPTEEAAQPVVADLAEVQQILDDYSTRNNAVIAALGEEPRGRAYQEVDGGTLRPVNKFDIRAHRRGYVDKEAAKGWAFDDVVAAWVPTAGAWPHRFMAAASSHALSKKLQKERAKAGNDTVLSLCVFEQASEGAPWRQVASGSIAADAVPDSAFGDAALVSPAGASQALDLARGVATYWSGGKKPAGFAKLGKLRTLRKNVAASRKEDYHSSVEATAKLANGKKGVFTFGYPGGILVLAAYRVDVVFTAASRSWLFWNEGTKAAAVWGEGNRDKLTPSSMDRASYLVPASGGARGVGYESNYALF